MIPPILIALCALLCGCATRHEASPDTAIILIVLTLPSGPPIHVP